MVFLLKNQWSAMKTYLEVLFLTFCIRTVCSVTVLEVPVGGVAVLDCPSNDGHHRFQYWQLSNDKVIGPGNEHNHHKYKYEVWSGRLFIKSVSTSETGFYKCISKQLGGASLNIEAIELVVKKDWEEVWEDDSETNVYRAILGLLIFLIFFLLGVFACFIRKRRGNGLLDLIEDSPSDTPVRVGGTYNDTTVPSTSRGGNRSPSPQQIMDNVVIDTDMKSSFQIKDY